MSLAYRLAYAARATLWERIPAPRLLIDVAGTHPPGRALDLGCGSGRHSILLAQHGWRGVGVDVVPRAIAADGPWASAPTLPSCTLT